MISLKELDLAVAKLSSNELTDFAAWFEGFMAELWNRQIEADILSGRLDQAGKQADEAFESGWVMPL